MIASEEREKILAAAHTELSSKQANLNRNYDQLRIKVLAFITGELALATFLFATGLKVPAIVYGLVFFVFGTGCIVVSFVLLLWMLKSTEWLLPLTPKKLANIDYHKFPTHADYLGHINKNYANIIETNSKKVQAKVRIFDISLMLLLAGVIILLVIKYGNGIIVWQNILQV